MASLTARCARCRQPDCRCRALELTPAPAPWADDDPYADEFVPDTRRVTS